MKPNFEKHKSDGLLVNSVIGYEGDDVPEGYESIDSIFPIETETYKMMNIGNDREFTLTFYKWGQLVELQVAFPVTAGEDDQLVSINLPNNGVDKKFLTDKKVYLLPNSDSINLVINNGVGLMGIINGSSATEDTTFLATAMYLKID